MKNPGPAPPNNLPMRLPANSVAPSIQDLGLAPNQVQEECAAVGDARQTVVRAQGPLSDHDYSFLVEAQNSLSLQVG